MSKIVGGYIESKNFEFEAPPMTVVSYDWDLPLDHPMNKENDSFNEELGQACSAAEGAFVKELAKFGYTNINIEICTGDVWEE